MGPLEIGKAAVYVVCVNLAQDSHVYSVILEDVGFKVNIFLNSAMPSNQPG